MKSRATRPALRKRSPSAPALQPARARPNAAVQRRAIYLRSLAFALGVLAAGKAQASPAEDARAVAALDTLYQSAVEKNDDTTMTKILADDFTLVTARGQSFGKADLLEEARKQTTRYEMQAEAPGTQQVRVWGDTAVVTALLLIKGTRRGQPIDYRLWFSDTYVRTAAGWRYVFGQASLPLPKPGAK
jgi:ketosteroid isomerase-like protein